MTTSTCEQCADESVQRTLASPVLQSALVVVLVVVLAVLTGCTSKAPAATSTERAATAPAAVAAGCPAELVPLLTTQPAAKEIDFVIDGSGSFWGDGTDPAVADRIRQQVEAVVAKAVRENAAIHVIFFTGSLASTQTPDAVVCSNLGAAYNNAAAADRKIRGLTKKAGPLLWEKVLAARPTSDGSSIVGGWRAISETAPLAARREVVMLTDGQGKNEDVPVELSAFTAVGMYGVGAFAGRAEDTTKTVRRTGAWMRWLKDHKAANPIVSTRPYTG